MSGPGFSSPPLDARVALYGLSSLLATLQSDIFLRTKVVSISRSASAGDEIVTGVGFRPRAVIALARFASTSQHAWSAGFSDGSSGVCLYQTGGEYIHSADRLVTLDGTASLVTADLSAISDDGLTLTFSSADAASVVVCLCLG